MPFKHDESDLLYFGGTVHLQIALVKLSNSCIQIYVYTFGIQLQHMDYYAALFTRRGPHIASYSVCLSVRLSVRPSRSRK